MAYGKINIDFKTNGFNEVRDSNQSCRKNRYLLENNDRSG